MPDAFDERLERVLAKLAGALQPQRPPDSEAANRLVGQVRRRHRRRLAQSGGLLVSAAAILGLAVGLSRPSSTSQQVNALGHDGTRTSMTATTTTTTSTVPPISTGPSVAPQGSVPITAPCSGARCGVPTLPTTGTTASTAHVTTTGPTAVPRTTSTALTTTTAGPQSGGMITVTDSASGETIMLHLGQSLRIMLSGSSIDRWSTPSASDPSILQGQPSGILPTPGSAIAQFRGAAVGQATVTASEDPDCRNLTPPCAMPSRVFTLTVDIAG